MAQLLPLLEYSPHFYTFAQDCEIYFIVQREEEIIPVEVKSSVNKNAVSFKSYIDRYNPKTAVQFSTNAYLQNEAITNIQLYLVGKVFELI